MQKQPIDFGQVVKRLRPIQIVAGVSFLIGKLLFIPAGVSLFVEDRTFGYWMISLYAFFITLSIVLCLIDIYRQVKHPVDKYEEARKLLGISSNAQIAEPHYYVERIKNDNNLRFPTRMD